MNYEAADSLKIGLELNILIIRFYLLFSKFPIMSIIDFSELL